MNDRRLPRFILSAAILLLLTSVPATSQEPAAGRGGDREDSRPAAAPTQFSIFPLQHAAAEEAAVVLRDLLRDPRQALVFGAAETVTADPRTNSLIVRGTDEVLKQVADIIKVLDQPDRADDAEIKVFALKNIAADAPLQKLLSELVADPDVKIAVEPVTNTVLAHGRPGALATIEALLLRLDEAPEQAPPAEHRTAEDVQVRVVWLTTGDGGEPPPRDLNNVVEELEKMGIIGLRTVAQMFVKTAEGGGAFSATGSAALAVEQTAEVQVSGQLTRKQAGFWGGAGGRGAPPEEPLLLQIDIQAREQENNERLADINTTITAPEGHSVVLGVTPVGAMTSVFVVQLRK
ncbi:MAG: hypothetical protein KY475_22540 [Planctomycetes bacterium]|nr:hypothetical protein [Planctomycetota bacterium]